MKFDPDVAIKGVILNRVAGPRHENVLRKNIEQYCNIPVLGAIPKLDWEKFPERHLGLVPTPEHGCAMDAIHDASKIAARYLDLKALAEVSVNAGPLAVSPEAARKYKPLIPPKHLRTPIGPVSVSSRILRFSSIIRKISRRLMQQGQKP